MNHRCCLLRLSAAGLLQKITDDALSGALEVSSGSVVWQIYFEHGNLTYASYSIQNYPDHSFERVKHYLNRLGLYEFSPLILDKVFQETLISNSKEIKGQCVDYQITTCLLQNQYIDSFQAKALVSLLTQEALELFLCIAQGNYRFYQHDGSMKGLVEFNLYQMIEYSRKRSKLWKTLTPEIYSIYQYPYLINVDSFFQGKNHPALVDLKRRLIAVFDLYSIYALSAFLGWDTLKTAKFLYPYVANGAIALRPPVSPFDQLPQTTVPASETCELVPQTSQPKVLVEQSSPVPATVHTRCQTVACIDDSFNMLDTIEQYLKKENLSVFKITEPAKAALQLRRIMPDLVLLDVGMPLINGYELCRMLRNNPRFIDTPIIMVTGRDKIIDKAKAKMVGATDYLTKPFTKSDLLEVVFKHLKPLTESEFKS